MESGTNTGCGPVCSSDLSTRSNMRSGEMTAAEVFLDGKLGTCEEHCRSEPISRLSLRLNEEGQWRGRAKCRGQKRSIKNTRQGQETNMRKK